MLTRKSGYVAEKDEVVVRKGRFVALVQTNVAQASVINEQNGRAKLAIKQVGEICPAPSARIVAQNGVTTSSIQHVGKIFLLQVPKLSCRMGSPRQ